jgi:hypothetical protein
MLFYSYMLQQKKIEKVFECDYKQIKIDNLKKTNLKYHYTI